MKKIIIIILGFFAAVVLFFVLKVVNFYDTIYKAAPIIKNHTQVEKKNTYNILLLGYGGGSHEGTYLTDSIMIIHLDIKKKHALLLSLPRDIWVKVPTKSGNNYTTKINSLYQVGLYPDDYPDIPDKFKNPEHPAELVKDIATQVSGLNMDNFIAVDFDSFKHVIDGIGGVDVNVDKSFDDYEYPIEGKEKDLCGREDDFKKVEPYLASSAGAENAPTEEQKTEFFKDKPELQEFFTQITEEPYKAFPCRYEHLQFTKGMTQMDGETALKYVRSRHSLQDGTDFARGRRQQNLILAVKDKILSISFIPKIIPLMDSLKQDIRTDLAIDDIKSLLGESTNANSYKIINLVLSDENYLQSSYSENGQSILIQKNGGDGWQDIHTWIKETLAGITPTPEVTKIPQPTLKK